MAINPYASEFVAVDHDRDRIVRWLGDYLRTGVVVPTLHLASGRVRFKGRREPIGQASWKWTEVAGKYVGCPYWSVAAMRILERAAAEFPRLSPWSVGRRAAKRERGDSTLQHEHVFPRKDLIALLSPHTGKDDLGGEQALRDVLERYALACIVTIAEHSELGRRSGDRTNPWNRYRGTSIRIADNPAWPQRHRDWIEQAGLLAD